MYVSVLAGRIWRNINRRISRLYVSSRIAELDVRLVRYGSGEGSWMAPSKIPARSVIYCGGVGINASFDFDLTIKTEAEVHSFDPTRKAIEYMNQNNTYGVRFHPWGMLDRDEMVRFYEPISNEHQSSFIYDLHRTGKFIEAPCYKIKTIMNKLEHQEVFLIKIDIEGSWYPVLLDMLKDHIYPKFICVEFDSPAPVWRVGRVMSALAADRYVPIFREKDNVVFARRHHT